MGSASSSTSPSAGPSRTGSVFSLSQQSDTSGFVSEESSVVMATRPSSVVMATRPPPVRHRPSSIIRSFVYEKEQKELQEEKKVLKNDPAMKDVFAGFEASKKMLLDRNSKDTLQFESVYKVLKYKIVEVFNKYDADEVRSVMGNNLARIGFVPALVDFYKFVIEEFDIEAVTNFFIMEGKGQNDPGYNIIVAIREILWNFSDSSFNFGEEIADTGVFEFLLTDLKYIYADGLDNMVPDVFALSSAVGILHNCARNQNIDREAFRKYSAVQVLEPYLQSPAIYVKMITLLALGNILNEQKLSKLVADTDVLNFLLDCITKAMSSADRLEHGFHVEELVEGLVALSQSNQTKQIIFQKHPLQLIKSLLKGDNVPEIEAALNLTYSLAFLDTNKHAMLNDKDLIRLVQGHKTHSNPDIKQLANHASFVLVDRDDRLNKSHTQGGRGVGAAPALGGTTGTSAQALSKDKHVMISYTWGDKETVLKIYQQLHEQGYKIWIDVAEMSRYANVLSGMAEAVENSSVVLMCFSEKYKRSHNCRLEAEYAFTLKKEIIHLKMERGYQPDGWLGILIGAKFYIEFSAHYPFEVKMADLLDRLKKKTSSNQTEADVPEIAPGVGADTGVREWTRQDIEQWMKNNKLDGNKYRKVKDLTGEQVAFLQKLMFKAPTVFYQLAREQLGLLQIEELMRFDNAFSSLK